MAGKLLPGQIMTNGVSNYIFGTNNPNYDNTFVNNTNVQNQMKAAGISTIRFSTNDGGGALYSDAQLDAVLNAIKNAGAQPLCILNSSNPAFNKHVVAYYGTRCMMYEFGNERDINGMSWQTYLNNWNTCIADNRHVNPNAAFIGPALGVFSNVDSYLIPWLKGTVSAGTQPDGISVHIYPCTGGSIAQQTCISRAAGMGASVAGLRTKTRGVLGYDVPHCLTEWNADAYYNNPPGGGSGGQGYNSNNPANDSFNNTFAIDAIEGFVANGIDMANHFEVDYFLANPGGATSSTGQYRAFATETKKYPVGSGGSTPPPSTSTISASPSSLSYSGVVNGTGQTQNVTITNTGNTGGTIATPVTYSAYSNLNWVVISGANTLGGNASTVLSIGCGPQNGMPAGTYTANIAVTVNGSVATISVTLTITGGSNAVQHLYGPVYAPPVTAGTTNAMWAQFEQAGTAVSFVIANPNSGPGSTQNADYVTGILGMHTSGIKVLGYVNTSTSGVLIASATVKSQIDAWYSFYNVDGIHLDAVLPTSANFTYYQTLYQYIKAKDTVRNYVSLNPAQVPPESYMPILDTVCIYEGVYGGSIVTQPYMQNYPSSKFSATVQSVATSAQVDTVMSSLKNANVGLVYITDQSGTSPYVVAPTNTVWQETLKDIGVVSTGGGSPSTTPLSVFFAAATDTTLATANQLYTVQGTPPNTWAYSRLGTSTGYGEIASQTETNAWEAFSGLGAPSGSGFLYESVALENNQLQAGNWSAQIRLNCAQGGDAAPQAGSITGDLYVRAFKRSSSGVYMAIVTLSSLNQTIPMAFTTFQLPSVATTQATPFAVGDKLYLDIWVNVHSDGNANNSALQDIRLNRLSQDITNNTGDVNASIVTPGFSTASSGGTSSTSSTDTFIRANQSGFGTASNGETWNATGPGTLSIVSNEGVIVSTAADTNVQLGANTFLDGDIRGRLALGAAGDFCGVEGRYSVSGGTPTCYKLVYYTGTINLNKAIAGVTTQLVSLANITLTPGTFYQFHLKIQGSTLYGNVYADGSAEPTSWMITTADTSIQTAGGYAVLAQTASGSTGIQVDHFSATPLNVSGGTPTIVSSSTALPFSAVQGGAVTSAQSTTLTNSGAASGTWTETISYAQGSGWLSLGTTSGTLAAGASQQVALSCNPAGLAPGTYSASVIFAMGASTANLAVTLVVTAASNAFLSVSPPSLNFTVTR